MTDPYSTLGVDRTATVEVIERAYSRLAKQHHPDRNGDRVQFEAVHEAYCILSSVDRRRVYDETGDVGGKPDDRMQHAARILNECLAAVVQQLAQTRTKACDEDVVKRIKQVLENGRKELKQQIVKLESLVETLDETANRITTTADDNLLAQLARYQLAETEKKVAACKAEVGRMQQAGELLAAYGYRWTEKVKVSAFGMPSWVTSTTTGGW